MKAQMEDTVKTAEGVGEVTDLQVDIEDNSPLVQVQFPDNDEGVYGEDECVVVARDGVDFVACELRLRKYVRRDGGYRKGITLENIEDAQRMLGLLGRKRLAWDKALVPFHGEQRFKA